MPAQMAGIFAFGVHVGVTQYRVCNTDMRGEECQRNSTR